MIYLKDQSFIEQDAHFTNIFVARVVEGICFSFQNLEGEGRKKNIVLWDQQRVGLKRYCLILKHTTQKIFFVFFYLAICD
jgi:hypothetical protein